MVPLLLMVRVPTRLAIFWRKYLAWTHRCPKAASTPRSVIVFRLDQLGDLVLTTPLFHELKCMYPNARLTVVVPARYQSILTTNRNIDEILPLHEIATKWLPLRARRLMSALIFCWTHLRHRQFDMAISPRWDVDESLATMLCALTNAGTRVGHSEGVSKAKRHINRGFDAAFDVTVPPGPAQHEVDRNLAVIEALGGRIEDRRLEICLTDNDRKFASELLTHRDSGRVLVAIGIGGRAASRRWPLQHYAECIARLDEQLRVQPVVVCSSGEDSDAAALSVMLPVPPYILSGVPLRAACAVLERCDLFVGNDSGTAHLAAAMGCATIVVSRHPLRGDPDHANSPVRFGPRCARYRVVQPTVGAGNCHDACRSSQPHCIKLVSAEMVLEAALDLLQPDKRMAIRCKLPTRSMVAAETGVANQVAVLTTAGAD